MTTVECLELMDAMRSTILAKRLLKFAVNNRAALTNAFQSTHVRVGYPLYEVASTASTAEIAKSG